MKLTLLVVVGGRISTLPQMLDHYLGMNVDEVMLYLHSRNKSDSVPEQAYQIAASRHIQVTHTITGEWSQVQQSVLDVVSLAPPEDWFLVADQDELQCYPEPMRTYLEEHSNRGWDYVNGCLLDRFSADGRLDQLDYDDDIWSRYPVAAFFSYPKLGSHPLKVVAARGGTIFSSYGHHRALNGRPCPSSEAFVPVHHFKWTQGVLEYLTTRAVSHADRSAVKREDLRFRQYYNEHNGRIDIQDKTIMPAYCGRAYPYWQRVTALCQNKFIRTPSQDGHGRSKLLLPSPTH